MADDTTTTEAIQQAEAFKAQGNDCMKTHEYRQAVAFYTNAIELNPDQAVYYSNRSAAYLALQDERGNALRDAEKCIELRPEWWKAYSRKGAAEHALQRFDAARATYQQGLALDPDNASLLQAAEDAYAAGQAHSQQLREEAKQRAEAEQRAKEAQEEVERKKQKQEQEDAAKNAAAAPPVTEDELLAELLSEVQELEESANCVQKDESAKAKDKPPVDFGTSEGQLMRLLQDHYEWINLNPFRVLMLDLDATEDDIKQHYRKISTLVHPDKFRHPRAREAFEQVTKAYELIMQEDRRKMCIRLINDTEERIDKERRQKIKKGIKECELGDRNHELEKAVIKSFAEIENRRRNLEKREAAQRRREAQQQEDEQEKLVQTVKRERSWAEEERRKQRIGNWRSFQKDGSNKKRKEGGAARGWKEESKPATKDFGAVDNDEYKKKWK